jgi:hypothetical protein
MATLNVERLRPATVKKYKALQSRFKVLYEDERRRLDDVEQMLCNEFFISVSRVYIILNCDLSKASE